MREFVPSASAVLVDGALAGGSCGVLVKTFGFVRGDAAIIGRKAE
jgi:hypothetical protein